MNLLILPTAEITKAQIANPEDPGIRVSSPDEMRKIAEAAVLEVFCPLDRLPTPEELLGIEGEGRTATANYQVTFDSGGWSQGIIGKQRPAQFYDAVASFIHHAKRQLAVVQAAGDWQICAYRIYVKRFNIGRRESTGISELAAGQLSSDVVLRDGQDAKNPQTMKSVKASEYRLMMDLALFDAIQAEVQDYWRQTTGKDNSRIQRYAETGHMGHMPPHMQGLRNQAAEVIEEFHGKIAPKLLTGEALARAQQLKKIKTLRIDEVARMAGVSVDILKASLEAAKDAEA